MLGIVSATGKRTETGTLLFIQNRMPPVERASYGMFCRPCTFRLKPINAPQPVKPKPVICAAYRLPARPPGIFLGSNGSPGAGDRGSGLVPSDTVNHVPRRPESDVSQMLPSA